MTKRCLLRESSTYVMAFCAIALLGTAPIASIEPANLLYLRAHIEVIETPSHFLALKSC